MDTALVVCANESVAGALQEFLKTVAVKKIKLCSNASAARRILYDQEYDIVIINAPLLDEQGTELALTFAAKTNAQVLLLIKNDICVEIDAKMSKYGVFTLPKPFRKADFLATIHTISTASSRMHSMQVRLRSAKREVEEIKAVGRAKCYLIEFCGMTEEQAHRIIEKKAMDSRKSKFEIALEIINGES